MTITKSQVVGKAIKDLPKDICTLVQTGDRHPIWTGATAGVIDLLSRCTLRYANSYGATYKIDPTSNLCIISNKSKHYYLSSLTELIELVIEDYQEFKPQEQPMPTQPQPGTHWERLKHHTVNCPKGQIIVVGEVTDTLVKWVHSSSGAGNRVINDFLKHFKPRPDLDTPASKPTQRRGLAFYKASGKPWTTKELNAIRTYCGDETSGSTHTNGHKYIYDDKTSENFMYDWTKQLPESLPQNYTILLYESVFETSTTKPISAKTTKPKTKPVAQPEPIIPTPIKEKPMASKPTIKDTATTLVAANKDAAVLAAKLEAGKILNRQVIKLIKPKLHPLVRGYADSPLASVVLANVVGFAIKQYAGDNAKADQLAEMMLQASAVESMSALNIEGLIDDLLSSVKLPKSVRAELNGLDEDYE